MVKVEVPRTRYAFSPAQMLEPRSTGVKNGQGPKQLLSLLDLFQKAAPNVALLKNLSLLAAGANNFRVRYAALLLLDKVLCKRPEFRNSEHLQPVQAELAALASDRVARTKWLILALLPKTDLHVHIDGSVLPETVMELAQEQGIDLAEVLEQEKRKVDILRDVPRLPDNPSLEDICAVSQVRQVEAEFIKMLILGFAFAKSVMQTKEGLRRVAYELIKNSAGEGVMHLTAIIAPCLHTDKGLSYDEIAEATLEGLRQGEEEFGVTWELSVAIYRGIYTKIYPDHPAKTVALAKRLAPLYPGQISLDVVGKEDDEPLLTYADFFRGLDGSGVIRRTHAGEMPKTGFNLMTALELGIKRIGHGIQFEELTREERKKLIASGAVFEVSPISNLLCLCISKDLDQNRLENHPIEQMLEAGATIALCTNDRAVFATNQLEQMSALERALGWQFISGQQVTKFAENLLLGGFHGIADRQVAAEHLNEAEQYFKAINQLLGILA